MNSAISKNKTIQSNTRFIKYFLKFARNLAFRGEIYNAFSYALKMILISISIYKYSKDLPHIVISGYGKVGKSSLAKKLAQKYGYKVIEMDVFRGFYWTISDFELRKKNRQSFYKNLLKFIPVSVIIEGDDLISENRHSTSGIEPLSIDFMVELYNNCEAKCFIIGDSELITDIKFEHLKQSVLHGYSWLNECSLKELHEFARESIKVSKKLKTMVERTPIEYIELNILRFNENVDNTIEYISKTVGLK